MKVPGGMELTKKGVRSVEENDSKGKGRKTMKTKENQEKDTNGEMTGMKSKMIKKFLPFANQLETLHEVQIKRRKK